MRYILRWLRYKWYNEITWEETIIHVNKMSGIPKKKTKKYNNVF